ncbi:unnamed protein product [Linum trigynum]|uniref:Uncharacterized protein n=1 Tax=Linum trigynum TaxID=586398 RepID=A0AAV2D2B1_9ROSI
MYIIGSLSGKPEKPNPNGHPHSQPSSFPCPCLRVGFEPPVDTEFAAIGGASPLLYPWCAAAEALGDGFCRCRNRTRVR